MAGKEIGLSELVLGVRKELLNITNHPDVQKNPILELVDIEFEIAAVVSGGGRTGLKLMLFSIGAEVRGEIKSEKISKIKMKFGPLRVTGDNKDRRVQPIHAKQWR